jgi:hypothetical protein
LEPILNLKRSSKGAAPPVQIPILLFVYTIIFLIVLEFSMLFWLQSSLNTAAKQIAIKAATSGQFAVTDAAGRCAQAAQAVGIVFPGTRIVCAEIM